MYQLRVYRKEKKPISTRFSFIFLNYNPHFWWVFFFNSFFSLNDFIQQHKELLPWWTCTQKWVLFYSLVFGRPLCIWSLPALFVRLLSFIWMDPSLLGFSSSKPHFSIRCDYLQLFGNINFKCKTSLKKLQPTSVLAANAQLCLPRCFLLLSGSQGWMLEAGCFHFNHANNPGKAGFDLWEDLGHPLW